VLPDPRPRRRERPAIVNSGSRRKRRRLVCPFGRLKEPAFSSAHSAISRSDALSSLRARARHLHVDEFESRYPAHRLVLRCQVARTELLESDRVFPAAVLDRSGAPSSALGGTSVKPLLSLTESRRDSDQSTSAAALRSEEAVDGHRRAGPAGEVGVGSCACVPSLSPCSGEIGDAAAAAACSWRRSR